ncbi:MAG TPA: ABC transporter permease subunit [Bradyrhizobium sp.]|nr:ABC transporter permease subunit [Bradyrhizobium sp.]
MSARPHLSKVALARVLILLGALSALELLCRAGTIDRVTMIPPSEMLVALWQIIESGKFKQDILFSTYNIVAASILAIVLGFLFGAALHAWPRARRVVSPLLAAYYAVPTFVFYPLLIVAFGTGRTALIVMGTIFGVVAMMVNTMLGLDRVPLAVSKTGAIMRLGPMRRLFLVRLPAAAPHLVTGIKLAVAYGVIGIIAGEFILATAGVGKRVSFAYDNFDNKTMYGMLLLLLIGVMFINGLLTIWEKRLHRRFGQR